MSQSLRLAVVSCLAVTVLALAAGPPAGAQTFTAANSPHLDAHVSFSLGASWVDWDADGDLDLYVVTGFGTNRNNVLYRNDGGTFVSVTGVPLALDGSDTACSSWVDGDNDGDLDVFVSNLATGDGRLYSGQAGAYTVNAAAGLPASLKGVGCAWGDYDADGFVDLVVAALFGQGGITTASRLFRNQGDGTFVEVSSGPIATTLDTHHHATWADHDDDGDLDLFFATGPIGSADTDRMYRNERVETGVATFTPITGTVYATDTRDSQTLQWVDVDNDGDLDLFAVNYTTVPNQLYRNDGAAGFTKIITGALVTDAGAHHGAAWGDYDNDGDLDVYVATDLQQSNRYYRNDGGGAFTRVTTGAFVNEARSQYGVVAGDYDGDGDLDLFTPTARSEGPSVLYRNDLASGAHWVVVRLAGTVSNRSAIGAKVRVRATLGGVATWQRRDVQAATGYGGQNALEAHVGLGDATVVDSLIVEWPSGRRTLWTDLAADARYEVSEATSVGIVSGGGVARLEAEVAPNPFRDRAWISLALPAAERVRVSVYDVAGRERARPLDAVVPAGTHRIPVDRDAVPAPGIALVRVEAGSGATARRAVLRLVRVR